MAERQKDPCSQLTVALSEAVYAQAQHPDAPSFDRIVETMTRDLDGVDRRMIVEAVTAYERHRRAQAEPSALSNLAAVKEDALIEGATRERIAAAERRLAEAQAKPKGRSGRKARNGAIEELRAIEKGLSGREEALARATRLEEALATGKLPAPAKPTAETATPEGRRAAAARNEVNVTRDIRDLTRSIDEATAQLNTGELAGQPRRARRTAKGRLEDLRMQRSALQRELGLVRQESELRRQLGQKAPETTGPTGERVATLKAARADLRRAARARQRIADLERQIAAGESDARKGRQPAPGSPELADLRRRRDKLATEVSRIRAQEQTNARLRAELKTGRRPERPSRRQGPQTGLQLENEALQSQVVTARNSAAIEAEITALEDQLKTGNYLDREGRPASTPDAAIAALRGIRRQLQREVDLRRQLGQIQAQIEKGQIAPPPRRVKPEVSKTISDLEFELSRAKGRARRILLGMQPRSWAEKLIRMPSRFLVNVLATGEFSGFGIQGMIPLLSRPTVAIKSLPGGLRAFLTEGGEYKVQQFIENHPLYQTFIRAKGYVSDPEGSLTQREEGALSQLFDRIPGLAGFNRFHRQYLNLLRLNLFEALANVYTAGGRPTQAEAEALANWANKATGRGGLGPAAGIGPLLADIGFAPRYTVSRFQILLGEPIFSAKGAQMKKAIATEYARAIGGYLLAATVYSLLRPKDDKDYPPIETDPTSSDFGKIRIGDVRVDILGGMAQQIVFLNRVFQGRTKRQSGVSMPLRGEDRPFSASTVADVLFRFGRGKTAPGLSIALSVLTGETFLGQPATPINLGKQFAGPITYQDIYQVMTSDMKMDQKLALSGLAMFLPITPYQPRRIPIEAQYLQDLTQRLQGIGSRRSRGEEAVYRDFLTGSGGWGSTYGQSNEQLKEAEASGDQRRIDALKERMQIEARQTIVRMRRMHPSDTPKPGQ